MVNEFLLDDLFSPWGLKPFRLLYLSTIVWLAYKQQKQKFVIFLEAESPRAGCQHGQFLLRALFWVADCCLLVSSHGRKRTREFSGVPFMRTLTPFMRAPTSWPNTFQRRHLLIPLHWEVRIQIWIAGDTNIQCIARLMPKIVDKREVWGKSGGGRVPQKSNRRDLSQSQSQTEGSL